MNDQSPCPSTTDLKRFLLGELDDAQGPDLEEHLLHCADCQSAAGSLPVADALIDALLGSSGSPGAIPLDPVVVGLMERLSRLRPAPGPADEVSEHAKSTSPPMFDTTPSSPARATPVSLPPSFSFLARPRGPGELGWLAHFRVLRVLGKGGMGMVLEAEDTQLQRSVAIKVMRPEIAASAEARERFLREARATAALKHPHVVTIYHVGEEGNVPFLVMEFLRGESLADRLKRETKLALGQVVRIGRETAEGLAAAHERGLIHRDIKPANLWLENRSPSPSMGEGRGGGDLHCVKVLDLGLARRVAAEVNLTQTGAVLGTPAYMSPEQTRGETLDHRSDLFSLGCVLYRMATGARPFPGSDATEVILAIRNQQPKPARALDPAVPAPLSDLIVRLLAKSPGDRPNSAKAVVAALTEIERGLSSGAWTVTVPAGSSAPGTSRPPPTRRSWRWLAAVSAVLLAALVAAYVLSRLGGDARSTPQYEGSVDIVVWTEAKAGVQARRLRLADAGALPLHPGNQIRLTARIEPAAYLYLFWIDSEGQAAPVYPWTPGQWGTRPAQEERVSRLDLPANPTKGYTIKGDQEGMETLVLLARDEPLPADEAALRGDLSGLPPQRPVQGDGCAAVWFENGRVVENDPDRRRRSFEVNDINDPVLRLQDLLQRKLQPQGQFTAAVSFARSAK